MEEEEEQEQEEEEEANGGVGCRHRGNRGEDVSLGISQETVVMLSDCLQREEKPPSDLVNAALSEAAPPLPPPPFCVSLSSRHLH